jgi:hypothetical protein
MKTKLLCYLALSLTCSCLKSEEKLPVLAKEAFDKQNPEVSLKLYEKINADSKVNNEIKSEAIEKISFIFSQFYQNYDSAIFYSLKDLKKSHQYCLASGYFLLNGNYSKAIEFSHNALQISVSYKDSMESCDALTNAALKYSEYKLQNHESIDNILLSEAWKLLSFCYRNEPESPYINEKRLETAILLKQGNDALQCWKDYFLIVNNDFPGPNLKEAYTEMESVMKDWNGNPLSNENNKKIILALSKSRFYPLIESLNGIFPIEKNYETDCILAFCKYRKEIENHIYSFYRDIALHCEKKQKFLSGIEAINRSLWATLYPNNSKKYSEEDFRKTLMDRFGTLLYFHSKGRIHVYFAGSAVIREVKPFEQYGYKANFNFSQIDFVFGNAYDFWYFNQGFRIGGWDENGENSHFRRNVLSGPIWVWNEHAKNQDLLNKWKCEIDNESLQDDSLARLQTLVDLPGLRDRIEYRFTISILDSLQSLNLEGEKLRTAFIKTLMEYDNRHNYWHEGRHNLDADLHSSIFHNHDSYEYWAKLSQISFANLPSFELERAFNYNPKTGPNDGHTGADAKIVTEYYNWMNTHKNEIKGLDTKRPLLCQVDLLTEDQIRNIARTLDPIYRKSIKK